MHPEKRNIKNIFLALIAVILSIEGLAQVNSSTVLGTVVDRTSKLPVEFATVQLLNTKDSSIINVTATDHKGKFTLDNVKAGSYVLRTSFIGYEKVIMPITVVRSHENIGQVEIGILTANMKEVVVSARKSLLNTSIDRKVYNVTQDIMAQSGSASDILKNIPSVEVDIEGEVSLRGSADVLILINGRPSPLMGKTRAEVLQQLPANAIERIEVITNPSARYKPDGTSGIINIVMKKNTKAGWNGTAILNGGNRSRWNGGINLNYKPGKLNLFANYNIRKDSRLRTNSVSRQYFDSAGNIDTYYTQDYQSPARPLGHIVTVGADYSINDANSIGLSGTYHYRDQTKDDIGTNFYYDKNHLLTSNYNRLRHDPEFEKEKTAATYWQHNFKKEDHELRMDFNVSASDELEDNHYTNVYFDPAQAPSMDNTRIGQKDNQEELTVDYSNPLTEDSKLEAGYDGSFQQLDMNFYGEYYDNTLHQFVKDLIKSNRFKYNESIHAFYGTYQRSYEAFGYSAGLRVEQAGIKGNLVTKDSVISNDYFKLYPTLHLSYKLKHGELQLNYSKRVHRAEGDDLNPFPEYQDPKNLRSGNPKLLPEIIHSFEFGFKWQNDNYSFVPSLYYRVRKNGFTQVIIPLNDSVLLTTQQNLSTDRSAGLELIFSAKIGKIISTNLSSNFFYDVIDASNIGYSSNRSIVSMSTNFNATGNITKSTVMQISCNYRSARLTPQGKQFANFVFNTGLRQDLFKKKLFLTLTASDLFNSLKQRAEINTPYLKQQTIGRRDARIIYLGISYRFGKLIKKNNEEKMQFDNNL